MLRARGRIHGGADQRALGPNLNKNIYETQASRSLGRAQNLKRAKKGQKDAYAHDWVLADSDLTLLNYLSFAFQVQGQINDPNTNNHLGEWEHIVISYIKQVIPPSIQETWHNWRSSMKKVEGQSEGGDAAGWGVEEADARNKKEASTLSPFISLSLPLLFPFQAIYFQTSILLA